jgi:hypothetical protein
MYLSCIKEVLGIVFLAGLSIFVGLLFGKTLVKSAMKKSEQNIENPEFNDSPTASAAIKAMALVLSLSDQYDFKDRDDIFCILESDLIKSAAGAHKQREN